MATTLFSDGYSEPSTGSSGEPVDHPYLPDVGGAVSVTAPADAAPAPGPAQGSQWVMINVGLSLVLAILGAVIVASLPLPSALAVWVLLLPFASVARARISSQLGADGRGGPASCGLQPVTAVPAIAQRHRRHPDVFIVGDGDFCRSVAGAVGRRRRIAGQWLVDSPDGQPPTISPGHELVVDSSCFAALRDRAPAAFEGKNQVLVVPAGQPDHLLLSDPLGPIARAFKRGFDISFALAALLVTLPCLLAAVLAIRLDSRGPALFRQQRVGVGGRRFTLYKLRTMTVGEEDPEVLAYMADMVRCQATPENGMFKLGSNRRITRVGRTLRRYSIDEVPQLLNVLKGDMSLIGPRPPIVEEAECYNDFHWQRLAVRPGITGLAQVNGRSRLRFDDIVTLDVRYTRSWSLALELKILVRTPAAVLSGRGAT